MAGVDPHTVFRRLGWATSREVLEALRRKEKSLDELLGADIPRRSLNKTIAGLREVGIIHDYVGADGKRRFRLTDFGRKLLDAAGKGP